MLRQLRAHRPLVSRPTRAQCRPVAFLFSVPKTRAPRQPTDTSAGVERRQDDRYIVSEDEILTFRTRGYVTLHGVLSEEEMDELEDVYNHYIEGRLIDLSLLKNDCKLHPMVDIVLPSKYFTPLRGNTFEKRAASIAEQLYGPEAEMTFDWDQLLAKPPHETGAVLHWHQDQAYWPNTADRRTAVVQLGVTDVNRSNGCIRYVPGTNMEPTLRKHVPANGSAVHVEAKLQDRDDIELAEYRRGDCTVHAENVLHCSSANMSKGWLKNYVITFRSRACVEEERAMGYTRSNNS